MRPASDVERRRLNETFARLCAIPSPFGSERACAEAVARELRTMGLDVEEDGVAAEVGAECGNLLARIPGRGERTILLCAHLDTVPEAGVIEPVARRRRLGQRRRHDPRRRQQGRGRGASSRSRGAAPSRARRSASSCCSPSARRTPSPARRPSTSRRCAATGATSSTTPRRSARSSSRRRRTTASRPTSAAPPAHAGIRPEDGRSAIEAAARAIGAMRARPHRRGDDGERRRRSTAASAAGRTSSPERCRIVGEVRSLRPAKAEASSPSSSSTSTTPPTRPRCACDVDVTTAAALRRLPPRGQRARRARRRGGAARLRLHADAPHRTGGGSDANAFEAAGLSLHEPRQRHRAQPRARPSASASPRSRACST